MSQFKVYDRMIVEIIELLKSSGSETAFLTLLTTRLRFLLERGVLATNHSEFELLGKGVYSMHVVVQKLNIRILYMFSPDKSPVLLHAFHEKAGHKKTDYTGKIELARERFEELKEEQ